MTQRTLAAAPDLAAAVAGELDYQYALWNADYIAALEQCRAVIGKLTHTDLRGYRALWLYLAGSAAWLAHQAGQLPDDSTAKDYFRQAQAAAPVLRWLVALRTNAAAASSSDASEDPRLTAMIERLEAILERMGTIHDRKFDAEEAAILNAILQDDNGTLSLLSGYKSNKISCLENSANSDWELSL